MSKRKETFSVQGMSCTGCETLIYESLQGLDGIIEVKASFAKMRAVVKKQNTLWRTPSKRTKANQIVRFRLYSLLEFLL